MKKNHSRPPRRSFAGWALSALILVAMPLVLFTALTGFPQPSLGSAETAEVVFNLSEAEAAEIECLALNIYYEAQGENKKGQKAVAAVTLNRRDDVERRWPETICDVVYQKDQFSWVEEDKKHKRGEVWKKIYVLAGNIYRGHVRFPSEWKCLNHFHSAKRDRPQDWPRRYHFVEQIGNHLFYGDKCRKQQVASEH